MSYEPLDLVDPTALVCGRCMQTEPRHLPSCPNKPAETVSKGVHIKIGPRGHQFFLDSDQRARFAALRIVYRNVPEDFIKVALVLGEENKLQIHRWIDLLWPRRLRAFSIDEQLYL